MAIQRVAVEVHLAIEAVNITRCIYDQWVDLKHAAVFFHEQLIKLANDLYALLERLARQAQRKGDFATVKA